MILSGFHMLFEALLRTGFLHLPFWLARYWSVKTTFFKRFPAAKQNRAQWAILDCLHSGLFLKWKNKFAGWGCKGRLSRVYLTLWVHTVQVFMLHGFKRYWFMLYGSYCMGSRCMGSNCLSSHFLNLAVLGHTVSVSDTRSQGQPACHEYQKKWRYK